MHSRPAIAEAVSRIRTWKLSLSQSLESLSGTDTTSVPSEKRSWSVGENHVRKLCSLTFERRRSLTCSQRSTGCGSLMPKENRGNFLEMNQANLSPDKQNRVVEPPALHTVFSTSVENHKKQSFFK